MCRAVSSNQLALEAEHCTGSVRGRQTVGIRKEVVDLVLQTDGHQRVVSGNVEWCHRCGCFAENRSKGLSALCTGIPVRCSNYGGMWGQRRKLLNGVHPKTNMPLPMARNLDGTLWMGMGGHSEVQGEDAATDDRVRDDGFYTYVPAKFAKVNSGGSQPSQSSFSEILNRFRRKEANQHGVDADVTGERLQSAAGSRLQEL